MTGKPPRKVRFIRAELKEISPEQCLATVELEGEGPKAYVGTAAAGAPSTEGLRATARATADALTQLVGPDQHALEVHEVELFDVFGRTTVIVYLWARRPDNHQALMGFCLTGADSIRAAALAVLNATNRFLDIG